jgi:hypothetical protein
VKRNWQLHSNNGNSATEQPVSSAATASPPPQPVSSASAETATGGEKTPKPANVRAQVHDARTLGDIEPAWVLPYLEALALRGHKMLAYRAAHVSPATAMRYRDKTPGFMAREEAAFVKALKTVVEPEIVRRATVGVKKIRYGRDGKILSIEREFSDQLVLRLAERLETGTWRQKHQVEHSGGMVFKTEAERKEALKNARELLKLPNRAEDVTRN